MIHLSALHCVAQAKGNEMRKTLNHVTKHRCKDVAASFAKRRALLVSLAEEAGATVLFDNGVSFRAEHFNASRERIQYMACEQGAPFANGPSLITRFGAVEYADLLLPKTNQGE